MDDAGGSSESDMERSRSADAAGPSPARAAGGAGAGAPAVPFAWREGLPGLLRRSDLLPSKDKLRLSQLTHLISRDATLARESYVLSDEYPECSGPQGVGPPGRAQQDLLRLAAALAAGGRLKALTLQGCQIDAPAAEALAAALTTNGTLRVLHLRGRPAGGAGLGPAGAFALASGLAANTGLRALTLRGQRLGPEGAAALADALRHNTALRWLDLGADRLGADGLRSITHALWHPGAAGSAGPNTTLEHLDVSENEERDEAGLILADLLRHAPGLRSLSARAMGMTYRGTVFLAAALKFNRTLTALDISGNTIAKCTVAFGDMLARNSTLRELGLVKAGIGGDSAGTVLQGLLQNPRCALTALDLSENAIGNGPAIDILLELLHTPAVPLRSLGWACNAVTGKLGDTLGRALHWNTVLTRLDLGGNHLGSQGAYDLVEGLSENSTLEFLDISDNNLWDMELRVVTDTRRMAPPPHLADLLARPNIAQGLRELSIAHNMLGIRGLQPYVGALVRNPRLHTLDVAGNMDADVGYCEEGCCPYCVSPDCIDGYDLWPQMHPATRAAMMCWCNVLCLPCLVLPVVPFAAAATLLADSAGCLPDEEARTALGQPSVEAASLDHTAGFSAFSFGRRSGRFVPPPSTNVSGLQSRRLEFFRGTVYCWECLLFRIALGACVLSGQLVGRAWTEVDRATTTALIEATTAPRQEAARRAACALEAPQAQSMGGSGSRDATPSAAGAAGRGWAKVAPAPIPGTPEPPAKGSTAPPGAASPAPPAGAPGGGGSFPRGPVAGTPGATSGRRQEGDGLLLPPGLSPEAVLQVRKSFKEDRARGVGGGIGGSASGRNGRSVGRDAHVQAPAAPQPPWMAARDAVPVSPSDKPPSPEPDANGHAPARVTFVEPSAAAAEAPTAAPEPASAADPTSAGEPAEAAAVARLDTAGGSGASGGGDTQVVPVSDEAAASTPTAPTVMDL